MRCVWARLCKYQKNHCYSAKPVTTPLAGFPRREHTCTLLSVTSQDRLTVWYYLVLPSSHLLFFQRALTMEALQGCLAKSTVLLDALSCFSRSRRFSAFFLAPVFFFGIFPSKREKSKAVTLGATQHLDAP